MTAKGKLKNTAPVYSFYSFKDHDPVLDKVDTIIEDDNLKLSKVSELSGVSATTLSNWRKRKTKRPQFSTVMAVARSLGYDMQMIRTTRRSSVAEVKLTRNVASKAEAFH